MSAHLRVRVEVTDLINDGTRGLFEHLDQTSFQSRLTNIIMKSASKIRTMMTHDDLLSDNDLKR